MIDPILRELFKDGAVWVGTVLGTAAAVGASAWKLRGRRDRILHNTAENAKEAGPFHYVGDPDNLQHKMTRKEYHVMVGHIDRHGVDLANIHSELNRLSGNVTELMSRKIWESFTRLESDFRNHVDRWEEGSNRAQKDRDELREDLISRLDRIEARLDGQPRPQPRR